MIQGNIWVYHFPTPWHLTIRCQGKEASPSSPQLLVNAGLLFNATACHISTEDLHIYAILRGSMQTELNTPHNFIPNKIPIISQHESQQLQELAPPTLQALDGLQSHLTTPLHSINVDYLLHIHKTSQNPKLTYFGTVFINLISLILLLGALYILLRSHIDRLQCTTIKTRDTTNDNPLQQRTPEPQQREREPNVFTNYSLQHSK
jgi:hypothetical protein